MSDGEPERHAEILVDLLEVCWWLLDTTSLRQWAREALTLAEGVGRGDLQTVARGWLPAALGADGDVAACVAQSERALAHGQELGIAPPAVSAGIDLLLNLARRHDVGRAEALIGDVASSVATAAGRHGWLWSLRLAEARAEIALARGDWSEALTSADNAVERSRARQRIKYEVIGRTTRAEALRALGGTRRQSPN